MTKRKREPCRVSVHKVASEEEALVKVSVWNASCRTCAWETWRIRWKPILARAIAHVEGKT